ncbi:SDA1 domain-containing protein [Histoplasma capsulatum var. duboisii H88]|uniref:SDA1 domain-containing protein n=1 Tax=Ajellomyces capsulatus (strain H88) TaxID=544711 RepID=A0A8A1LMN7_AJEC8|nr:SDA1 domain-containing protein [Histoplasma capsulatum var. duboisii H88]
MRKWLSAACGFFLAVTRKEKSWRTRAVMMKRMTYPKYAISLRLIRRARRKRAR